jgi:hypothetical protein
MLTLLGSFLHCFCRHCGVPLWVECDGILDTAPLTLKFRELVGTTLTIGINVRTMSDISRDVVAKASIITYRDTSSDSCILDTAAPCENLVQTKLN